MYRPPPTGVAIPDVSTLGDRRIDASFSIPLASRPQWAALRAAAMLAAAVILLVTPAVPRVGAIAAILATGAACQPALLWAGRGRDVSAAMALGDVLLASSIAALMPSLYPAAALWIGTLITWQAIASPTRVAAAVDVVAIAALGGAGVAGGVTNWWMIAVTQAMLTGAYLVFGNTLRGEVAENELDLLTTVSVGGAIVHRSGLTEGRVTQVHGDVHALTGYSRAEWIDLDMRSIVHPDDVADFWIDPTTARPNTIVDRVGRIRRGDGTWMWLRDVSRVTRDRLGHLTLRGLSLDVTESQESHAEISRQARRDAMTGLPNRLALHEEMASRLGRGAHFAMLLVDLDRFKEVNDTLGHESGDHVLTVLGNRLTAVLGPHDLLARMGGDEFAIVVDGATGHDDVGRIVQEIALRCSRPIVVRGISLALSASTGIAFAGPGSDAATVLRHADIAMYAAKRAGTASRVFDGSLERTSTRRLSLTAALPKAIERGEVELFFQPQHDLRTGRVVSAEGLVRWRHPEFGLLTPDEFLDVALLSEVSAEFVRHTFEQSVRMIRRISDLGVTVPISVNASIASIRDLDLTDDLLRLLERHDVPAELLTIEITENDVDRPSDEVVAALHRLRDVGVKVSIDDFGTGHSSLERLRTLHVDEVKLDRMFVGSMVEEARDRKIVQTIIDLADRLGISVVAEGVERRDQADLLLRMGCNVGQGFLYAPALQAGRFEALVAGQAARATNPEPVALGHTA